jgi:hypothetical protein
MAGPKDEVDPIAAHAELIGRVAIAWNDLHRVIGQLFEEFSDSEAAMQRYWSVRSDATQRNLAFAAGMAALRLMPELRRRFETAMREIDTLAGDRNAALHTYWTRTFPDRKIGPHEQIPKHGRLREDFVAQFTELVEKLGRYQTALWNLHIDYFARKP